MVRGRQSTKPDRRALSGLRRVMVGLVVVVALGGFVGCTDEGSGGSSSGGSSSDGSSSGGSSGDSSSGDGSGSDSGGSESGGESPASDGSSNGTSGNSDTNFISEGDTTNNDNRQSGPATFAVLALAVALAALTGVLLRLRRKPPPRAEVDAMGATATPPAAPGATPPVPPAAPARAAPADGEPALIVRWFDPGTQTWIETEDAPPPGASVQSYYFDTDQQTWLAAVPGQWFDRIRGVWTDGTSTP